MALSPWPLTFQTTSRNGKGWQDHKGHLLFKQLLELAKDGRIPKHLANCQVPKCPACLFGKITKKPWRTKGKDHRRIRKEDENTPGANTSVNQMESTMQSTGKLLQAKNNGTMIFIDHFSSFTYLHLMTSLSSEQTMATKATYEQIAQTYSISIHGYTGLTMGLQTRNGSKTAMSSTKISPSVESLCITKMGSLRSKSVISVKAPGPAYCTQSNAGSMWFPLTSGHLHSRMNAK